MKLSAFRLSTWQMTLFVFLISLCVTPFSYDASVIRHLQRQAWMAIVPASGVGLVGMWIALALAARFPGQSIVDYVPRVFGPVFGRLCLLLLGLVLFTGAPANLHILTRLVRFVDLPRTPPLFIAVLFTAVVAFGCYFGPELVARMAEVLIPVIAVGLVVIFFVPMATAIPDRLLPLSGFHLQEYWTPSVSSSLGTVRGFLCVLVLGGSLERQRGAGRPVILAVLLAALLLMLSLAEPVTDLGVRFAEQLRYPILAVNGTVSFRWLPFQRLSALIILVWQMVMYVVLAFYLWSGTHVLSATVGAGHWRTWMMAGAVVAAYLGGRTIPVSVSEAAVDIWNYAVVVVGVLGPGLVLLASRRRGELAR